MNASRPPLNAKPPPIASDSNVQDSNTIYHGGGNRIGDGSEGKLSIPFEHSTAAHKLLRWPSIQKLLYPLHCDEAYVMELEAKRSLVSSCDIYNIVSPAEDGPVPPTTPDCAKENRRQEEAVAMDIELSGLFNVSDSTTRRYYQSYLSNIHKIQPFLDQAELSSMVNDFIKYYCLQSSPSRSRVEETINNAIILLVLAIGALCECECPSSLAFSITDIVSDYRTRKLPIPLSPVAYADMESQIVAGLSLYGYATSILGQLQGGTDLKHVQANLLAGIYVGQLAHPFQAHGWISQASRACQMLLRGRRYQRLDDHVQDLSKFAYWTCLQLESNILAELDLPPSGLSRLQGEIDLPKGKHDLVLSDSPDAAPIMMMLFYSAQIHLRRILNHVYTEIYNVEPQKQVRWPSVVQEALSTNLDHWRMSLPDTMKWEDSDPPATEINAARMRAKFYATQYITFRPTLYTALHNDQLALRGACKICIDSAIRSTTAFDGIKGRLNLIDIYGTAHAQFGNMLVLSATYQSSLKDLVDRDSLKDLLQRTIRFLLQNGHGSPSLQFDAKILITIYQNIFLLATDA
ncbi:unnamed protein product [Penicillium salamii]|nr:unnamed protein product [Penicillium salamii]